MSGNYQFGKYTTIERWSSYWHQINEALKLEPESILEIGVGEGVFSGYLKNHYAGKIAVASLDCDSELSPDVIGDVRRLPFAEGEFDLVCAFEVLEHLPFEEFSAALIEMKRVSKKFVVISLPHWGRHFSFSIRLPFFKKLSWQYKFNLLPIKHEFAGEHYWEIGKRGYPLELIKLQLEKSGFSLANDFIPVESPYHHFFILEKI